MDGAPEIVIEVRSPGDESYEKVPWYVSRGAKAVLLIDRDTLAMQLFTQQGPAEAGADGAVVLEPLSVRLALSHGSLVVDRTELEL